MRDHGFSSALQLPPVFLEPISSVLNFSDFPFSFVLSAFSLTMARPTVPMIPFADPRESTYYHQILPTSFTLHPTWVVSVGLDILHECLALGHGFPDTGVFDQGGPKVTVHGSCVIGVWHTAPTPRSIRHAAPESWVVIKTWLMAAIQLYVGALAAGWSIQLQSGMQINFWQSQVVNLNAGENMVPLSMTPSRNGLPAIVDYMILHYPQTPAVPAALPPAPPLHPDAPLDVVVPVPAWSNAPALPLLDCAPLVRSTFKAAYFMSQVGLFMRTPILLDNNRCSYGIFFTSPPQDGRGAMVPRMIDENNLQHASMILLRNTVGLTGGGGYLDLPGGLQVVLFESSVVDPRGLCSLVNKVSLKDCLETNIRLMGRG